MGKYDLHKFEVEFIRETDMAILIDYEGEEVWLPKSQIEWPGGAEQGDEIEIMIPAWRAEEKGME